MRTTKQYTSKQETPLMAQYYGLKKEYPQAILLFRVGDFYETFGDDAVLASQVLGIVLTKRANGAAASVPLAGFPYHAIDSYLPKLIAAGHRVAICDQAEDPRKVSGRLVKRSLSELVTPALSASEELLQDKENRYLASVFLGAEKTGLALLDLSTGEFLTTEDVTSVLFARLETLRPAEIIFSKAQRQEITSHLPPKIPTFSLHDWHYTFSSATDRLLQHFQTSTLKGFGVDHMHEGLIAAGTVLQYLKDTSHETISHITTLHRLDQQPYLWIDNFTARNLELTTSLTEEGKTLLEVLDQTATPMGGRLLYKWLRYPLRELASIEERQARVAYFYENTDTRDTLITYLKEVGDVERLTSRAAMRRISAQQLLRLAAGLARLEDIKKLLTTVPDTLISLCQSLHPCKALVERIQNSLRTDAAATPQHGRVFQMGVDATLDQWLTLAQGEQEALQKIQEKEAQSTGISSLKVGYNKIFGHYLEVKNTHKNKVPSHWYRKQTLSGAERYITEELKEYEDKILRAEEEILTHEAQLYEALLEAVGEEIKVLQNNASILAQLDILSSWGTLSQKYNYTRPVLDTQNVLHISKGRHPVIEQYLPTDEKYVPNDLLLDTEKNQILLITGPNMSGKSAILRQTALLVIMAQMGCFVPAAKAQIGLRDKLFTRVGATDNISAGQSTFMVEMHETASILHNMTERSLLLMDEIGRGTSTYDGISVAWSIIEHIHEKSKAWMLFATHYHELSELADRLSCVQNFHVSAQEINHEIVFLHQLKPGSMQQSFGIHVARMAGMPKELVGRAEEILKVLQQQQKKRAPITKNIQQASQTSFFPEST